MFIVQAATKAARPVRPATIATVAILLMIAAIATQSARAGQYVVHQCDRSYGPAFSGWTGTGSHDGWIVEGCTDAIRLVATNRPAGRAAAWNTPSLPGTLKLASATFMSASDNASGNTAIGGGFCTAGSWWYGICPLSNGSALPNNPPSRPQPNATPVSWTCNQYYECKTAQFRLITADGEYRRAWGHVIVYDLAFAINDPTPPTVVAPQGGTLRSDLTVAPGDGGGTWNSGAKTVSVIASDAVGSGITTTHLFFDGDPNHGLAQGFGQACVFTQWRPCPETASSAATVSTRSLTDGAHIATARGVDAGGLAADATVGFKVDNTPPDQPTGVTVESEFADGWQTTNDFHITWTNGAETIETLTRSGLAFARVDVDSTSITQADPPPMDVPIGGAVGGVSAAVDAVKGLQVPEKGRWKVTLSLVDRAGNVSPVGADGPSVAMVGWDDVNPPPPDGEANEWISQGELARGYDQHWTVMREPSLLAPICGFAGKISREQSDDPGTSINIRGDVREWRLPADLSEADHWVHLRTITCGGLASQASGHTEARVDLTAPTPFYADVEDDRWYADGAEVTIGGRDELSGMTPSTNSRPDGYVRGAYLDYTINGVRGEPIRGGTGRVTVTGEGRKELSFTPVDSAGNAARPTVIHFGVDATAPSGRFEPRDPELPTVLEASLEDAVSGLELALIEVRRKASGDDWQLLPTALTSLTDDDATHPARAVATARFPDTSLPHGAYEARVRAFDVAGNALVTTRGDDGRPFAFTNPMRERTELSAGLFKVSVACLARRAGRCVKRRRGAARLVGGGSTLGVDFNRGAVVQGVLTGDGDDRLARRPLEIYTREPGRPEVPAGTVNTRGDGTFHHRLKPGLSRVVRIHYPGDERMRDTDAFVRLSTAAKISLRLSRRRALSGQTISFSGRVRSFDGSMPTAGKIIVLQFRAGGSWRPAVAVAHTDARGRFRVRYRFDRTPRSVRARIVFRVFAPTEDGWGHAASASKPVVMRLN